MCVSLPRASGPGAAAVKPDRGVGRILTKAAADEPIARREAELLLALPEDSLDAALLRAAADAVTRRRFANRALLLGQIGVDMAPCDGDCAFCAFARSHTDIRPSALSVEEIVARCERFAAGGARGVFLMTMHRFGFEWFRNLCAALRRRVPAGLELLANVGDLARSQFDELRAAGVAGAYHVCRLREGVDSRLSPAERHGTIERILEAGLDWYTLCEPIGPEHTPRELAGQIWLGVDLTCRQHGAMQRFPVPGSPLFPHGQISLTRLGQVAAVVALATIGNPNLESVAVNVSNLVGLFSGANAFFPEAGEPDSETASPAPSGAHDGFTTALWRRGEEITTADCRAMLVAAGFSSLIGAGGEPDRPLRAAGECPGGSGA